MLGDKEMWTANSLKTLIGLSGEVVHSFVAVVNKMDASHRDWLLVFESGWSLQVTFNRAFWVNNPEKTRRELEAELARRRRFVEGVEHVEKALNLFSEGE